MRSRCVPLSIKAMSPVPPLMSSDVFTVEPATENPLFGHLNVVCTPHLGAATLEAQEAVSLQIADQLSDYLLHGTVANAVNAPPATPREAPRLAPYIKLAEPRPPYSGEENAGPVPPVCARNPAGAIGQSSPQAA
jgi:D-3-phosphoglycerate dehydrogenase